MPKGTMKTKAKVPQSSAQELGSIIKSCRQIMRKDKGLSTDLDRLPMLTWIMFLKFLDDMETVREAEYKLAGKRYHPAMESPYRWRDWAAKPDGITGPELIAFINQDEAVRPDGKRGPGLFAYLRSLQSANGDRRDVIARVFKDIVNKSINGYLLRDVINKVNGIHFTSKDEIFTLGHMYESMLREMRDAAGDAGEFYTPRAVVKFIVEAVNPRLGETVLDPAAGTGGFLVATFEHLQKQTKRSEDYKQLQRGTLHGVEAKPLPYLLCEMNLLLHGIEYPDIDPENALRFPLREIGDRDRVDVILTNPPFGGEEERGILSNFPEDKQTEETALLFLQLIMRKIRRNLGGKYGRAAVVVPESVMSDLGVAQRIRQDLVRSFNLHTVVRLPKGVFEPYSDIQTNILFFDNSGGSEGTWFYEHKLPADRLQMRNPCYTQTMPLKFEELVPILDWWGSRKATENAWFAKREEIESRNYNLDFRNPLSQGTDIVLSSSAKRVQSSLSTALESMRVALERIAELRESKSCRVKLWLLSDFLFKVKEEVAVVPEMEYRQVTVRLYGKGVELRGVLRGNEIKTRPQFAAKSGHLIMSRIDARNGAFGIVPPELDGALITGDFPLFRVDSSVILPEFLALIVRSSEFNEICKRSSKGTTNRKRLREGILLNQQIAVLEDLDAQRIAVEVASSFRKVKESLQLATGASNFLDAAFADELSSLTGV